MICATGFITWTSLFKSSGHDLGHLSQIGQSLFQDLNGRCIYGLDPQMHDIF